MPDEKPKDDANEMLMGMPLVWSKVVNVGAIFLICFMFYRSTEAHMQQSISDREMFRTALQQLHQNHQAALEISRENQEILMEMHENIERNLRFGAGSAFPEDEDGKIERKP